MGEAYDIKWPLFCIKLTLGYEIAGGRLWWRLDFLRLRSTQGTPLMIEAALAQMYDGMKRGMIPLNGVKERSTLGSGSSAYARRRSNSTPIAHGETFARGSNYLNFYILVYTKDKK